MRKPAARIIIIGTCLVQFSCSAPSSKPIWINESLNLTKEEGQRLILQAENGDVEACKRLADYYYFVHLDEKEAILWLRKALKHDPQNSGLKDYLAIMEGTDK